MHFSLTSNYSADDTKPCRSQLFLGTANPPTSESTELNIRSICHTRLSLSPPFEGLKEFAKDMTRKFAQHFAPKEAWNI